MPQSSACVLHPKPIKAGTGISLASRCDIAVTHHRGNRITPAKFREQAVEALILGLFEWTPVTAFEFNADGEVVAVLAAQPIRCAGMPGPLGTRHELDQFAVTPQKKATAADGPTRP